MICRGNLLVCALVALAGCFPETSAPDCPTKVEALRVGIAYEGLYSVPLTEAQIGCAGDFRIAWVDDSDADRWCSSKTSGCYYAPGSASGDHAAVLLRSSWWDAAGDLARSVALWHELEHHVIRCAEGDSDPRHEHPAWGGTGLLNAADGTLAAKVLVTNIAVAELCPE